MRILIGPVCDRFGPRLAQTSLLSIFSLPVFLVGTSRSYAQWTIARFFIGFIGASFVVTQFWSSIMFSGNIIGTANATSGGWGNLGGGVTNGELRFYKLFASHVLTLFSLVLMPQIRLLVSIARGLTPEEDKLDDVSWR